VHAVLLCGYLNPDKAGSVCALYEYTFEENWIGAFSDMCLASYDCKSGYLERKSHYITPWPTSSTRVLLYGSLLRCLADPFRAAFNAHAQWETRNDDWYCCASTVPVTLHDNPLFKPFAMVHIVAKDLFFSF
jgi:hypothetical protein